KCHSPRAIEVASVPRTCPGAFQQPSRPPTAGTAFDGAATAARINNSSMAHPPQSAWHIPNFLRRLDSRSIAVTLGIMPKLFPALLAFAAFPAIAQPLSPVEVGQVDQLV